MLGPQKTAFNSAFIEDEAPVYVLHETPHPLSSLN